MEAQSVKNTDCDDAGKKVSGIKRYIAVDTEGLPHAIHITAANVIDRAGALGVVWIIAGTASVKCRTC